VLCSPLPYDALARSSVLQSLIYVNAHLLSDAHIDRSSLGKDAMRARPNRRLPTLSKYSNSYRLACQADLALASGDRDLAVELVTRAFLACDQEADMCVQSRRRAQRQTADRQAAWAPVEARL